MLCLTSDLSAGVSVDFSLPMARLSAVWLIPGLRPMTVKTVKRPGLTSIPRACLAKAWNAAFCASRRKKPIRSDSGPKSTLFVFAAAFRRAGSEYDVRRVPQGLVTTGAFRYSRNPGYVLMIAFCAGIGLAANNPWVFLALVPAIFIVHYRVVLREEAVLEKQFGEDYLEYQRRVRRWI